MRNPGICLVALGALFTAHGLALAQEDFYRGKQLQIVIRAAPGGSYDAYSRLLARHMPKHIPGAPSALPVNMPGAGGLAALNYFDRNMPHDGTALHMPGQTLAMEYSLGLDANLKVDVRALAWIGNVSEESLFLVTRRGSKTRDLDDAKRHETLLSATGVTGPEIITSMALNHTLGAKFKNIAGFRSGPEMNLAMQRAEVDGRIMTNLNALFATVPEGRAAINVLAQFGMARNPAFPEIVAARELATSPRDRMILDFVAWALGLGRTVATNAGVPAEHVEILRRAFEATMRDPDFLAEAKKQDLDVSPQTGEQVTAIVEAILNVGGADKDELRRATDFAQ